MEQKFDNIERNRYYGLRVGDLVIYNELVNAEVAGYGVMDNNSVRLCFEDGSQSYVPAECCEITTKVEDRNLVTN